MKAVTKSQGRSRAPSPDGSDDGDVHHISSVRVVKEISGTRRSLATPTKEVQFRTENGVQFNFKIVPDTGATRTIVSHDLALKYALPISKTSTRLKTSSGAPLNIVGETTL